MASKTEHYTGADCTGSSAAKNRVLTISNTATTSTDGFLVEVSGLALTLTADYTVSHLSSSTAITFLNKLWDSMKIVVDYVEQITGVGAGADGDDFAKGPLNDFGVEVTRTAVTITTDFHGDKTYTDGSDTTIEVVFENPSKKYNLDKPGLTEAYDARIFTLPTETLNKYDKITYDSKVYRVGTVSPRNFNGTVMFKMVTLFFLKDA